jgi:hypothetical protein
VTIKLEERVLEYYDPGSTVASLSAVDADAYREYVEGFIERVYKERSEYTRSVRLDATNSIWNLTATYYDGSIRRIVAEHGYPDDWDEFLERTNALVGFDLLQRGGGDGAP